MFHDLAHLLARSLPELEVHHVVNRAQRASRAPPRPARSLAMLLLTSAIVIYRVGSRRG
jgi:hypothetical protein